MRVGTPKKLKTPIRHRFRSQPKIDARGHLIDLAKVHVGEVKRIFTLPGEEGHCAVQFLKEWPDATIVGIDRDGHTLDRTELTHRGIRNFVKPDGSSRVIIDSFYHTTVNNMVRGIAPRKRSFLGELHTSETEDNPDYAAFDLSYLDYCGKPTTGNISNVGVWISNFAKPNSIVGVTFNRTGLPETETAEAIMQEIERRNQSLIRGLLAHEYASDGSTKIAMCLLAFLRI